jgi:predicted 3-demethylubiquinone-9 3-methyltransferase (glyoxalase superfamily)
MATNGRNGRTHNRVTVEGITPFLWFDDEAEDAAKYYTSMFNGSRITAVSRVMAVTFKLGGQELTALNGGPVFEFTPAVSLYVSCPDQNAVDTLWGKLSRGGKKGACGWLEDKYGLSWQIVPKRLHELLGAKDTEKANRVMRAMLKMSRIDIKALERAYHGR